MVSPKSVLSIVALLMLAACAPGEPLPPPEELPPPAAPAESPAAESQKSAHHDLSIPALLFDDASGADFRMEKVLAENEAYTRHYISYSSSGLKISGIMNVPKGEGPFPVLVLNHGHIDTSVYTNGRGLKREQDYLARQGYVVIHPDYRNHAESDDDNRDELAVRLGYAQDAMNALHALRQANPEFADTQKAGMLGHSMGGGVTLASLVSQPDLIDAAVLYAPVSGDLRMSFERWMSRRPEAAKKIEALYGLPEQAPEFWSGVSAETFYSRIAAPILIFHGAKDADVPLSWSQKTLELLRASGKQAELVTYPNAPHEFIQDWPDFMRRSTEFFDRHLK